MKCVVSVSVSVFVFVFVFVSVIVITGLDIPEIVLRDVCAVCAVVAGGWHANIATKFDTQRVRICPERNPLLCREPRHLQELHPEPLAH